MTGNITKEQFKKFCKDFIEKYEGWNFQELIIKRLCVDCDTVYKGICNTSLTFVYRCYGLGFGDCENDILVFGQCDLDKCIFINCHDGKGVKYFYTIEDLYKFFKMNEKENKETNEITLEVNLEDILKMYKEDISKKLGMSSDNIKINLKRG